MRTDKRKDGSWARVLLQNHLIDYRWIPFAEVICLFKKQNTKKEGGGIQYLLSELSLQLHGKAKCLCVCILRYENCIVKVMTVC